MNGPLAPHTTDTDTDVQDPVRRRRLFTLRRRPEPFCDVEMSDWQPAVQHDWRQPAPTRGRWWS